MQAIVRLWSAVAGLAGALERLTVLAHAAADAIETKALALDHEPAPARGGKGRR